MGLGKGFGFGLGLATLTLTLTLTLTMQALQAKQAEGLKSSQRLASELQQARRNANPNPNPNTNPNPNNPNQARRNEEKLDKAAKQLQAQAAKVAAEREVEREAAARR